MNELRVALVGAEQEENLSLRYLASAVEAAGFPAVLVPHEGDPSAIVDAVIASGAAVVGLSVPFQHRAPETLALATLLRARGFAGHITAGGHFATFEHAHILRDFPAIDSVVRHEGEETLVDLCRRLRDGAPHAGLPGLIARDGDAVVTGPKRPLPALDALPSPDRRGAPHDVLGVPAAPMLGSRGCWADCTFCCIHAYADNADGPRYRMRSPESIAAEMKQEHEARGVRLFVFHDDNFFVPDRRKNLRRYRRLAELLREAGLDDIGLVIKCRPDDVDAELLSVLRDMGMIRAYVGIETNSNEGVVSLNRRVRPDDNRRALAMLRDVGLYCSFNVLIFDPEATLAGVAANLDFMAEFADVPFNFCRAEVYAGTPLEARLAAEGRLHGDYRAWDYEMRDPRVELLFRITTTAFYARNFKHDGVANLNMGIRFDGEVLRRFWTSGWDAAFGDRLHAFSRAVGEDTVAHAREALAFVRAVDPHDHAAVNAFTLALARRVSRADLGLLGEVKALRREVEARARAAGAADPRGRGAREAAPWAAETARLGASTHSAQWSETLLAPADGRAGGAR